MAIASNALATTVAVFAVQAATVGHLIVARPRGTVSLSSETIRAVQASRVFSTSRAEAAPGAGGSRRHLDDVECRMEFHGRCRAG